MAHSETIFKRSRVILEERLRDLDSGKEVAGKRLGGVINTQDGDSWHDPVLYQAQQELERAHARADELRRRLCDAQTLEVIPELTKVAIGHEVDVRVDDPDDGSSTETFTLGSPLDALALNGSGRVLVLSVDSPMGMAIFGKRICETGFFRLPEGGRIDITVLHTRRSCLAE